MNAHEVAEQLCVKAEGLGLCHPTESMIAECLDNALSNQLNEIDYELREAGYKKAATYLARLRDVRHLEKGLEG